jgi:hypothetical protein
MPVRMHENSGAKIDTYIVAAGTGHFSLKYKFN